MVVLEKKENKYQSIKQNIKHLKKN